MPIKNDGAEMPSTLAKTEDVSIHVLCFIAAITPSKIPNTVAISMAVNASSNVPGNASPNISETFFF